MDIETEAVVATRGGKRPGEEPTLIEEAHREICAMRDAAKRVTGQELRVQADDAARLAEKVRQAAIYDAQRTAVWEGMVRDVAEASRLYHIEKRARQRVSKDLARREKISLALAAVELAGLLAVIVVLL